MKLLIEVEAPGLEHLHVHEPALPAEVAAFMAKLIRSRTRGPQPKVEVHLVNDDAVLVTAPALLRLQAKATILRCLVECDDRELGEVLERAKELVRQ